MTDFYLLVVLFLTPFSPTDFVSCCWFRGDVNTDFDLPSLSFGKVVTLFPSADC